jgi:hypothetical protein
MTWKSVITAIVITVVLYAIVSLTPARQYALLVAVVGFLYASGPTWYQTYLQHQQTGYAKRQEQRELAKLEKERQAEDQAKEERERLILDAQRTPNLVLELNGSGMDQGYTSVLDIPRSAGATKREYDLFFLVRNVGSREAPSFHLEITIPRRYEILHQASGYHPNLSFTKISGALEGTYTIHFKWYNRIGPGDPPQVVGTAKLQLRDGAVRAGADSVTIGWKMWSPTHRFDFENSLLVSFLD